MGLFDLSSLNSILGEDTTSKIPVLGSLTGAKSDEYKALLKKQEEMAKEMAARRQQQHNQSLQGLSQSMLAFNPRNQMMAQMFGPEAAFTPQQFAAMAQDPAGPPKPPMVKEGSQQHGEIAQAIMDKMGKGSGLDGDGMVSVAGYTGNDPAVQKEVEKYVAQLKEYNEREARRRQMLEQGMSPIGPGPAPIKMPAPQRGRR
jgi:hypothetical protein